MFDFLKSFRIPIVDFEKENCRIGDIYDWEFSVKQNFLHIDISVIQEKFVEWLIEQKDKFEVENIYWDDAGNLVMRTRVLKNPLPFLVVFGAIVGGSSLLLLMFGLTLSKVHKVIMEPGGKVLSYAALLIVVIVGYKFVFK